MNALPAVVVMVLLFASSASHAGDEPEGKPFTWLAGEIEAINTEVDGLADEVEAINTEMGGLADEVDAINATLEHDGEKVGPGLYKVHTKVLWDVGWVSGCDTPVWGLSYNEFAPPNPSGRNLCYGVNQTLFLAPLTGYGVPDVPEGATRKVRLYANYGHQLGCSGTPTIRIGDVEFSIPQIHGFGGTVGAGWSDFKAEADYGHLGHASIAVYLKDFHITHGDCSSVSGSMRGSVYRVEAYFYDEFAE